MIKTPSSFCGFVLVLILAACATSSDDSAQSGGATESALAAATARTNLSAMTPSDVFKGSGIPEGTSQFRETTSIMRGTGNFLNTQEATKPAPLQQAGGVVTLNFEAASIRDVVKVVFDTLQENYVIDPQVDGEVTVQTSRPLPKEALIPTLETLLRMNNAALVRSEGIYKVVPLTGATVGHTSPRLASARRGPGFSVRIFPLQYISAGEMEKILQPFAPEGGILRVDPARNMLMLAGTTQELANLQETITIFDVNWLEGMTVGMYVLRNMESGAMVEELEKIFGEASELPLAGMFRFIPVERLNALLVITTQRDYLKEVSSFIERLDGAGGERLYVYNVQNGDAEYIAGILNQVFEGSSVETAVSPAGRVAPGRTPTQLSTGSGPGGGTGNGDTQGTAPPLLGGSVSVLQAAAPRAISVDTGLGASAMGQVRIIADSENNSLLIWASSQNYERILNALRKVDITPRQVLVEATIAEVRLTDGLQYGFQWYFENNVGDYTGIGSMNLRTDREVDDFLENPPGSFAYALVDNAGLVRALLRTLASESKVRILSSPQIMVIDNQEATIRVGVSQPVQTAQTVTTGGTTTSSIEFRDTGVLLTVQPQVNAGGLITMEIVQEVTDVGPIDTATGQRSFLQRNFNSQIAIQSGKTIVLGGLIRDQKDETKAGFPVLYKLPVVGPIFGSTNDSVDRTELIVLITPRVVRDNREAEQVTADLKQRMQSLTPMVESIFEPSRMLY